MKRSAVFTILSSAVLLLSGITIIVSVLNSQQNLAPKVAEALSLESKVVTIGDSLSTDPPGTVLYSHYPSLLKSVYNVATSDSFAVGAAQTGSSATPFKGMRLQYSEDVEGKDYQVMIIMGGVNDVASGVSASTTEANLDWIYSQARAAGMKVVAISILPWGCFSTSSDAKKAITKEINAWIKLNPKVDYFVDAYGEFNDGSDCLKEIYNLDNVHINRAGQDKLALMIYDQVFQGVAPTTTFMKCGEVGCTTRGDDTICGWPTTGNECKSGYNGGEGRCEIVCTGTQVKIDPCNCAEPTTVPSTVTPTPVETVTPTDSPSLTPTPTFSATSTPVPSQTVAVTTVVPTTISVTQTLAVTATVRVTNTVTFTNTPTVSEKSIPKTALNEDQIISVIIGFVLVGVGFFIRNSLKHNLS